MTDAERWLISRLEAEARENERLLAYVDGNDKDAELEAAETTCQSLREQSSCWEAQALEAGVRIAELEAQVRGLREIADQWDADKETLLRGWFAAALIRAALAEPQEGKEEPK